MGKIICMTGSPKDARFSTKSVFIGELSNFGYSEGKMTKKNNQCQILCTDDLSSDTSKMRLAKELGIEIMTYAELAEAFDLQGDL